MTDEPITITLTAEQERAHKAWLAKADTRDRNREGHKQRMRDFMHPANSTIIPASGVWVIHGIVEHGDFSEDVIAADWPDEAIRKDSSPLPLIGWRVTNKPIPEMLVEIEPLLVLPDGEWEQSATDVAFGSTPEEAIGEARRLLRADHARWKALDQACAESGHRQIDLHQETIGTCRCTAQRVNVVSVTE